MLLHNSTEIKKGVVKSNYPHYVGQVLYRTDKNQTFFVVSQSCFFGEYSKEEVRRWLDINSTPKEAYERVGIELESA